MKLSDIKFADEEFKACVLATGCDTAEEITELTCRKKKIKDITGIEYLTELKFLDLTRNQLTSVDLSKNTKLEEIFLGNNALEYLDISNCSALTHLEVFMNELEAIDVSNNPLIEELWADLNSLTDIDLSKSAELTDLRVNHNDLTAIDISNSPKLAKLEINENPLSDDIKTQLSSCDSILLKI